jgi:hypothetical protein
MGTSAAASDGEATGRLGTGGGNGLGAASRRRADRPATTATATMSTISRSRCLFASLFAIAPSSAGLLASALGPLLARYGE